MRVLITGGAGFIGSHRSDAYIARGDEVYVIDDLSTGSIENVEHLKKQPRFHYVIEPVQNYPELVDRGAAIIVGEISTATSFCRTAVREAKPLMATRPQWERSSEFVCVGDGTTR